MGPKGLALLKRFEGWRASAYPDPGTGGAPWTIGYGHTSMAGPPKVTPGMTITKAEGEKILKRDLKKYEDAVKRWVRVPLSQEQFDALTSFVYNVGEGNFKKSSVLKRVNQGRFDDVPARLMLWNKAGGRVLKGLTRRRSAEGELFASGERTGLREGTYAAQVMPDAPRGKSPMQSTTNLAAGASAIAGVTAAGREIVDNTSSMLQAAPWIVMCVVIVGCTLWVWHERNKKSREEGI